MKHVGLITIHNAYNYGAVLQATATQQVLESMNCRCSIIDYDCTPFLRDRKRLVVPAGISDLFKDARGLVHGRSLKRRADAFTRFMQAHYHLAKPYFLDALQPQALDAYDLLVTGSDQTFCLHLKSQPETMRPYFLENVRVPKISYASSMGEKTDLLTDRERRWMGDRLKEYACLSVREEKSADLAEELTGRRPQVVLDPTLLLTREEWSRFACPADTGGKPYILFFSVLSAPWVIRYVQEASRRTGMPVIAPHLKNRYELTANFRRMDDSGPDQFLSLVRNASLVLTTSFHGTAFALNFRVPFVSMIVGSGARISSLLNLTGLSVRAVREEGAAFDPAFLHCDWGEAEAALHDARRRSLEYLRSALDTNG